MSIYLLLGGGAREARLQRTPSRQPKPPRAPAAIVLNRRLCADRRDESADLQAGNGGEAPRAAVGIQPGRAGPGRPAESVTGPAFHMTGERPVCCFRAGLACGRDSAKNPTSDSEQLTTAQGRLQAAVKLMALALTELSRFRLDSGQ